MLSRIENLAYPLLFLLFTAIGFGIYFTDTTYTGSELTDQEEIQVGEFPDEPSLSIREGKYRKGMLKVGRTNSKEYYQFRAKVDSFYKRKKSAGWNGAVLVAYQGRPLYYNYIGYANYGAKTQINANTSFQLASTSKPFTALAILMLQERGQLNIYDDVRKYIPEFPYSGISIKSLLTHRSGMQDYINFANNYWSTSRDGWMSNEQLQKLIASKKPKLIFTPNSRFKYTNTNYATLASIVERVTKQPFKVFLKRNIFDPLRMTNTSVVDPRDPMPTNASKCYKGGWNEYKFMYQDGVFGDKGVFSTVQDMLKFDRALYTTALVSRNTLYAAFTPQCTDMKSPRNYGYGWRMYLYPSGEKIIYHNGLWHGNNSCFYRFIQDRLTIIVQCNKFTTTTYDHPSDICDILSDVEDINNSIGQKK